MSNLSVQTRTMYRCNSCNLILTYYAYKCPCCGHHAIARTDTISPEEMQNTMTSNYRGYEPRFGSKAGNVSLKALSEVKLAKRTRASTGIEWIDRLLGQEKPTKVDPNPRGLVLGSTVVIAGPPGLGKTTILLQVLYGIAKQGYVCAYLTAEQAAEDVVARADEIGVDDCGGKLLIGEAKNIDQAIRTADDSKADFVVIDSIGVMTSAKFSARSGSPTQVTYCAKVASDRAHCLGKFRGMRRASYLLVAHATKDGDMSGPMAAEHAVDAMLIGEHFNPITGETLIPRERMGYVRFRSSKNRFGDGLQEAKFQMKDIGLVPVDGLDQTEENDDHG